MSKSKAQTKPTISIHVSQKENQKPQKTEKQPSWAVVRGFLACRNVEIQQQQQQKEAKQQPQTQPQQPQPQHVAETKHPKKKQEQRKLKEERVPEENNKKCKKMKCSGSLCNNTGMMAKPETSTTATTAAGATSTTRTTTDTHKKKASLGGSKTNLASSSSRSMKAPLNELNGRTASALSSSSQSAASSNSSGAGSFRGMPFRRLSGCYECRMVVDPVLGFTRDSSLRSSICSCPDCGEVMKTESLEHHQAVKHAGISIIYILSMCQFIIYCFNDFNTK